MGYRLLYNDNSEGYEDPKKHMEVEIVNDFLLIMNYKRRSYKSK